MKKIAMGAFVLLLSSILSAQPKTDNNDSNDLNKVLAKVGEYEIKKAELDRQVNILMPRSFFHSTVTDEKLKKVQEDAMEELIKKHLLLKYAKEKGYSVKKSELRKKEREIKKAFGSKENFEAALKQANLSYSDFKTELERDLILQKLYEEEIKVELDDKYLSNYYEKNKYKFKVPEKIKIKLIYIRNDPTDPKGNRKAKKRAEEVYEKIKNGEDFSELAAKYSNAMSRIKGGDMGFIHKGMLDEPIEKVAYSLKKGEVSEIIETPKGYYIIKMEEITPATQLPFEKVKDKLKKELIAKYEKQNLEKILNETKKVTKIEKSEF